jgi:hypothetical protein
MKRRVTVHFWLLMFCLLAMWASGMIIGYSVGIARADQCSGWNGRFFQTTNCDGYQCTGFSIGPFWTQNCTTPPPSAPVP